VRAEGGGGTQPLKTVISKIPELLRLKDQKIFADFSTRKLANVVENICGCVVLGVCLAQHMHIYGSYFT